jgi:hypothetical protein
MNKDNSDNFMESPHHKKPEPNNHVIKTHDPPPLDCAASPANRARNIHCVPTGANRLLAPIQDLSILMTRMSIATNNGGWLTACGRIRFHTVTVSQCQVESPSSILSIRK